MFNFTQKNLRKSHTKNMHFQSKQIDIACLNTSNESIGSFILIHSAILNIMISPIHIYLSGLMKWAA